MKTSAKGPFILLPAVLLLLAPPFQAQAQPEIKEGQTQTWYGRVNHWAEDYDLLVKELDYMAECGVSGYMIEMSGWGKSLERWNPTWVRQTRKAYRKLLRACRKRHLWLFVSIINDNMGRKKYGDVGPPLKDVVPYAHKLVGIVKRYGPKGVVVQPSAETQTDAGREFEKYCADHLKGFILVYNPDNWPFDSPNELPEGFSFRSVHPGSISKEVPPTAFAISDHGLIIRALNTGHDLCAPADPVQVAKWAGYMRELGVPVIGYYAFQYNEFDGPAIATLGEWGIRRTE